ncbi:MAG: MFS transporter [Candidatus Hydrogenedens sp.]|nr:MFS transporter [Candidatus Hydrogenedens sp.]
MNPIVRVKLSIMMFLEFFVWGAWAVTMGTYLGEIGFEGVQIGNAYTATGWAAIVSPFFIGMIADRYFAAERVMAFLHLIGAVLMYYVSTIQDPGLFFWALVAYALCYMPTLALVNAIAMNVMEDSGKEFPMIRVFGTIGWIAAGLTITLILDKAMPGVEKTAIPLKMAALASAVLGVYSFLLPHTPPKSTGKSVTISDVLGLEALGLMRDRSFAIFILSSLLVCIPLAFYYNFTNMYLNAIGMEGAAGKMSMGQMSEIFFMVVFPLFFARLGVKWMLAAGMLAWAVRYVFFAYGNTDASIWMLYGGILLHGVCYDFFFMTGQIYVDREAPKAIQASAQGFIALVTYGVGMVIGSLISGKIVDMYATADGHAWTNIWLVPAGMAFAVLVGFVLMFREPERKPAA